MLQQTRADVVVPYFERWMRQFPDVHALAIAPLESVIKAWEGLGYYSRARNLHAAAKTLVAKHEGSLPVTREALLALPGLGSYTTGAILSFGFQRRAAAVDGNVLRVMARYAWIDKRIDQSAVRRQIEALVEETLDAKKPWITMEALIELGATVCTPQRPRCDVCPLQAECSAFAKASPESLPMKAIAPRIQKIVRSVAIVEADGAILVRKNDAQTVMQDLVEFPYFEGRWSTRVLCTHVERLVSASVEPLGHLPPVKHSFTRFQATLFATRFRCAVRSEIPGWIWMSKTELHELAFSAGHRQLLSAL